MGTAAGVHCTHPGRNNAAVLDLLETAERLNDGREAVRLLLRSPSRGVLDDATAWDLFRTLPRIAELDKGTQHCLISIWAEQRLRRREGIAPVRGGGFLRVWGRLPRSAVAEVISQACG